MNATVRLIAVRLILLWAVLLLPAASSGSQPAGIDNLLTGYSLTSWSTGVGEPLGSVYAIVQDEVGYLWLGSDAGLLRFDGSNFPPGTKSATTPFHPWRSAPSISVDMDGF